MIVHITITGDSETRGVKAEGHIDDMMVVHWLLGEALRIAERRAQKREAGKSNGTSGLVVVPGGALPPVPPT